jgi:hypothetical protein
MKIKVTFAPGALDNFEGSQEDLDLLVKQIQEQVEEEISADLYNIDSKVLH